MQASKLKRNDIIEYKNDYWIVTDKTLHGQARNSGLIKLKLKNINSKNNLTINSREKDNFVFANITYEKGQYLYDNKESLFFLINNTYETIELNKELNKENIKYLIPNKEYNILHLNDKYISFELPNSVELKVIDTADNADQLYQSKKEAFLENGFSIMVPKHIKNNDIIVIKIPEESYLTKK